MLQWIQDDYRRTFPFKLIGPIINVEQLYAGDQLDREDLSMTMLPGKE